MTSVEAGLTTRTDHSPTRQGPHPLTRARWDAAWISAAGDDATLAGGLAGLDADPIMVSGHEVLLIRRDFELDDVPEEAYLRIASDSRHLVHINGVLVAAGPQRSQPRRLIGDLIEITSHLRAGSNSLAIEVTYYGSPNALWMPARGSGELGTGAALLCEVRTSADAAEPAVLATDESWSVRVDHASQRITRSDVEGVPAEIFDARERDADWTSAKPAEGWQPARILRVGHMAGGGRPTPPADPYGAVPTRVPGRVEIFTHGPSRARALTADKGSLEALTGLEHPTSRINSLVSRYRPQTQDNVDPANIDAATGIVEYDFGRIVSGRVIIEVNADRGTVFDMDFRELPVGEGPDVLHGMRYIARGADDRFHTFEIHGLRYLAVTTAGSTQPPTQARIASVAVDELNQARTGGAVFRSGDASLDMIWAAGIRTVQVNSTDTYTDCPTREQRAWVGDGVVALEVDMLTTSNHDTARRYVWLAMSPRADGLLPMSVAGDIEFANSTSIPAWSLHWIHAVLLLARHDGIDALVREALPVAERALRWFEPFIDDRGTLRDIPEWCFVDWSSSYTHGRSSIMSSLWARALGDFAVLSRAAGNIGSAEHAERLYEAARRGFEDFWDAERGLYVDSLDVEARTARATSQLASAGAIVSGLAPQSRWATIAELISDPLRLIESTWYAKPDGFDDAAIAAASIEHPVPHWDVETQIVRAQPFGAAIVHEALAAAGAIPALIRSIRDWGRFLAEGRDTFGEGWGWGTTAHGWSSAPTRDLVAYVVGASPTEWGGTRWRIQPALDTLETISARIPIRRGTIDMTCTAAQTLVTAPVPIDFVTPDGSVSTLEPGRWRIRHPKGALLDVQPSDSFTPGKDIA